MTDQLILVFNSDILRIICGFVGELYRSDMWAAKQSAETLQMLKINVAFIMSRVSRHFSAVINLRMPVGPIANIMGQYLKNTALSAWFVEHCAIPCAASLIHLIAAGAPITRLNRVLHDVIFAGEYDNPTIAALESPNYAMYLSWIKTIDGGRISRHTDNNKILETAIKLHRDNFVAAHMERRWGESDDALIEFLISCTAFRRWDLMETAINDHSAEICSASKSINLCNTIIWWLVCDHGGITKHEDAILRMIKLLAPFQQKPITVGHYNYFYCQTNYTGSRIQWLADKVYRTPVADLVTRGLICEILLFGKPSALRLLHAARPFLIEIKPHNDTLWLQKYCIDKKSEFGMFDVAVSIGALSPYNRGDPMWKSCSIVVEFTYGPVPKPAPTSS